MAAGAVNPDEPWSLEHVLNIIGTVTLLFGAAKLLRSSFGPDDVLRAADDVLDNAARAARDSLDDALKLLDDIADDTLDDTAIAAREAALKQIDDALAVIAKEDGVVTKMLSADDLNAAQIAKSYEPSYVPGTNIYEIRVADNTRYVRVFIDEANPYSRWIMKADDITGLTAAQIKDNFAIPDFPMYICDVDIPSGTTLRVSIANEISMWGSGGGVQYYLVDDYLKNWFNNIRTLP